MGGDMRFWEFICFCFCLGVYSHSAMSATTSSSTKASSTLASSCQFDVSDVVFGNYDPNASDHLQSSQTLNIKCTRGTAYTVWTFAPKNGNNGTYGYSAAMTSAEGNTLLYQIYEKNRGVWDDDMNLSNQTYLGTGTGKFEAITYNYRIIKNQYIKPSIYTDTVRLQVTF